MIARKQPQTVKLMSATGWMADNWPQFTTPEQPAIILNPEASDGAALAWCYGEARSLCAAASALTAAAAELSTNDVAAIFWHRLVPLVEVMGTVLERMALDAEDPSHE